MNQLKKAGVDLEEKNTIKAVSKQLDRLLDKLEEEIGKMKDREGVTDEYKRKN